MLPAASYRVHAPMTYNFDPDRWYDDQRRLLELRRHTGALDEAGFEEAARDLERRYEAMLARLDGTYELKGQKVEGRR